MCICRVLQYTTGYKCYLPPTRKVIITKDVTFDENRVYYQCNTEFKGEREITSGETLTPLPFLNTSEERDRDLNLKKIKWILSKILCEEKQTATNTPLGQ